MAQSDNKSWEVDYDFNGTAGRNPYIRLLAVRDYAVAGAGRGPGLLLAACQPAQTKGDHRACRQVFARVRTPFPTLIFSLSPLCWGCIEGLYGLTVSNLSPNPVSREVKRGYCAEAFDTELTCELLPAKTAALLDWAVQHFAPERLLVYPHWELHLFQPGR